MQFNMLVFTGFTQRAKYTTLHPPIMACPDFSSFSFPPGLTFLWLVHSHPVTPVLSHSQVIVSDYSSYKASTQETWGKITYKTLLNNAIHLR